MDKENTVFRSLAIIEENIREKLTVEALAESVHFSKYHYQRIFKEIVGHSVMRYVTRRRLALAAEELINTDNSILDIALIYGYDSHEGFSRSFKACMGIAPKEYRKYRPLVGFPLNIHLKEKSAMLYPKTADEIISELNRLIVQSEETAEYLRKNNDPHSDTIRFYSDFWEHISAKTDALAKTLSGVLKRITDEEKRPDEITARFILIKTVEDAVIQLNLINFQTGLTV
ncbi:MAG: AraC family transcriptional regulator, partial [Ruminiclostridium sp.]|nr:AraC family transcriptional regulator [Ruminiclostridium sp.]